jgi:guanine deaminase
VAADGPGGDGAPGSERGDSPDRAPASRATIVRARILHTPRDPFDTPGASLAGHGEGDAAALECYENGAVAFQDGEILATGDFAEVSAQHPDAEVVDERDAFLLPGLVDTHVHWPQLGAVGAMGLELLDWLRTRTLPEETKLADLDYARPLARDFIRGLAANGTTTALVFGTHFPEAQEIFFEAAAESGLRLTSGLVVSDRDLLAPLRTTPDEAHDASAALARRWHANGRLRYAITPRFSISCSEEMLESCGAVAAELDGAFVTSHLNENRDEVEAVLDLFEEAGDYLDTYEHHGLVGPRTVMAHDVHPTDAELGRMAASGTSVAHCPSSNVFLGSGIFPMRRHLDHGVRFGLGTDVGAGTGLSMLKEGLAAYQGQMIASDPIRLAPAHLLWLATAAGARVLSLRDTVGDLTPGKAADLVLLRPPEGSTLAATLARSESPEQALGALITLAREESVMGTWVGGDEVHRRGLGDRMSPPRS